MEAAGGKEVVCPGVGGWHCVWVALFGILDSWGAGIVYGVCKTSGGVRGRREFCWFCELGDGVVACLPPREQEAEDWAGGHGDVSRWWVLSVGGVCW